MPHHPYPLAITFALRIDRVALTLPSALPMLRAVFSPLSSSLPVFLAQASAALELAASLPAAEAFVVVVAAPPPEAFAAGQQVRQQQDDCLVVPMADDHSAPAARADLFEDDSVLADSAQDESLEISVPDDWFLDDWAQDGRPPDDYSAASLADDYPAQAVAADDICRAGSAPADWAEDDSPEPHYSARVVVPSQADFPADFPAHSRQADSRAIQAFPLPADSRAGWDCRAVPWSVSPVSQEALLSPSDASARSRPVATFAIHSSE